jgi:hypothetical protein
MTLASSLSTLFSGPNTGLLTGILIVAVAVAGLVLWMLVRLIVDPRASSVRGTDEPTRPGWDEAQDPAYDDSYVRARGDATG